MEEKTKQLNNIRNFVIIAHIDHGKSTLADRMLELTGTIEKRKMREQVLDQMELERERGITIKLQPVRMSHILNSNSYILNLIDTPGHIDFSYEVSRSLRAVEGAVLLVDATQGVQAQTFSNLEMAKELGLKIIPVLNKIDLPNARIEETEKEIIQLVGCKPDEILKVSAKTGQGVSELLEAIVEKIPPPLEVQPLPQAPASPELQRGEQHEVEPLVSRALIFDFSYSVHQGVIAYVRVFEGEFKKGEELFLINAEEKFKIREVGFFKPELKETEKLGAGEIGYVVTNIKNPGVVKVGDTIINLKSQIPALPAGRSNLKSWALEGYREPKPMIWANFYPESQNNFDDLRSALEKLHLSDSSFSFKEESFGPPSAPPRRGGLGRGFKLGFLGLLHLEIISERLKREFGLKVIAASPTVAYRILLKDELAEEIIYSAASFPEEHKIRGVFETWVNTEILTSSQNLGSILKLLQDYEAEVGETVEFSGTRLLLKAKMPLRELMRNFFDALKNISSGFASLNYEIVEERPADVLKLEILVAENPVSAFSRIVPRSRLETEAEKMVEKLKAILPRELFSVKIQAKATGRILAARTLSALRKHVTGNLYGGDRTRKMKLWQKQKKGKERLKARGSVDIPQEVFLKMIRG